jgi:hypothetical protein
MAQEYYNQVEERDNILLITLTMGKKAIADNTDFVREILRNYNFITIKRRLKDGSCAYYAVSISIRTGRNYLHRLILGNAQIAGQNVYHRDGNSLNCCRANLVAKSSSDLLSDARQLHSPATGVKKSLNRFIAIWTDSRGVRHHKCIPIDPSDPGRAYGLALDYCANKRLSTLGTMTDEK